MTSNMCTCDLATNKTTSIILIMILTIEKKRQVAAIAYQTAPEPVTLVDITLVVVILLGTVQKCLVPITTKVASGK